MSDPERFEIRFAAAYRRYLAEVPAEVDAAAVARAASATHPRVPSRLWPWALQGSRALLWLGLVALFLGALGMAIFAGSQRLRPLPAAVVTPSPRPSLAILVTMDVAYDSVNPRLASAVLDVYAPSEPGPWPVAVMFHGFQDSRASLASSAHRVADQGFVVFVPAWSATTPPSEGTLLASNAQAACAVAFAQRQAARYGGDPATTVVYGWSAGANVAAIVAFARPEPAPGCLAGAMLDPIDALVTWAGGWVLSVNTPDWDTILAADPAAMDAATPWRHLAEQPDLKVVMLVSEDPGAALEREVGDPWAADSWLAARDPSGDLRRRLEANGAFVDGTLDWLEVQQLLFTALQAQGNPVSLDVLPDSTEESLEGRGWEVFLAAFEKAAAGSR